MRWIKYSITVIMSRLMLQCVELQVSSKLIYEDFDGAVSTTKFDKFLFFSNLILVVTVCYYYLR